MNDRHAAPLNSEKPGYTADSAASIVVAAKMRGRDGGSVIELGDAATLCASSGGASNSFVAFSSKDYAQDASTEHAPTLRAMANPASKPNAGGNLAVLATGEDIELLRRLMPTECEALQGLPRDFTQIAWRGKPAQQCPDGPRYKALGNSMAVPVLKWILTRLETVDAIIEKGEDNDAN